MSIESTPADASSPRADLVAAVLWMVFGAAITVGAWTMDRLEHRHINPYEIPGLVPGVLGAVILLLGLALAVRAVARGAMGGARTAGAGPAAVGPEGAAEARRRMAQVLAATLVYALVLVGHGVPFWLATFVFVAGFIWHFDGERQRELGRGPGARGWRALVFGAATSATVTLVFEQIFLVRLP